MGLRFRKTISILPGVRVNLGKSTQSISVGIPGFRKTFNTKGQVTTTVGLPGTGLYYVDTKNPKKEAQRKQAKQRKAAETAAAAEAAAPAVRKAVQPARRAPELQTAMPRRGLSQARFCTRPTSLNREQLVSIHKTVDDSIDWNEILASPTAPDDSYNPDMWNYYHSVAEAVLGGDIDTYLSVIYDVNPLDDLLDYGSGFTFGTDDPSRMEVEFTVNESALFGEKFSMDRAEYNDLLQDFVCSTAIRVARDIFALLPVQSTIVHAELKNATVLSAQFDRATMDKIRFGFVDPSDTLNKFNYNMEFDLAAGFAPVERIV